MFLKDVWLVNNFVSRLKGFTELIKQSIIIKLLGIPNLLNISSKVQTEIRRKIKIKSKR